MRGVRFLRRLLGLWSLFGVYASSGVAQQVSFSPTPLPPPRANTPCDYDDHCYPWQVCNTWDGVCCNVRQCPGGTSCNVDNSGLCRALPTPTPTLFPDGAVCDESRPLKCVSGFCTHGVCCHVLACEDVARCDITGSEGACIPQKALAEECGADTDCVSDNCEVAGGDHPLHPACAPARTPTPCSCHGAECTCRGHRYGPDCDHNGHCAPGLVCNQNDGGCCQTETCPSGTSCTVDNSGLCKVLPTPTPT